MAVKRKKQREKSRYRWAVICILSATIVIVALDIFCILMTSYPELLQKWFSLPQTALAVSREDGFLSSGLSLIGLAISVWATLNIINVLDKKEVADLRSQLAKIKEENENYTQEQYYNILFNEFERCSADSAMKYLAQKMRNMDNLPYAQLALAMQYYTRVYELNKIDNASLLMDEATDEGIYYIEQLLKQDVMRSNKTVEMFLHYCLGEFHFYKMYCHQGRQRYENATRAATEYTRSFKLFNTRIPEFTTEAMESYPAIKYSKAPEAKVIAAYLCNAYGECHSEMVQGIKKDKNLWSKEDAKRKLAEFRDKAIFYCSYAVHWTDNSNQAYLRNLGCALEAAFGSEAYDGPIGDKMYEVYQNAMDACVIKSEIPRKVFYTWLSLNHKYSEHILDKIYQDDPIYMWRIHVKKEWKDYSRKAQQYVQLAQKLYPDKFVFMKFHVFILRDLCIWEILYNGRTEQAEEYFSEFHQMFIELKFLYPDKSKWDPFMISIKKWDKKLTESFAL